MSATRVTRATAIIVVSHFHRPIILIEGGEEGGGGGGGLGGRDEKNVDFRGSKNQT